MPVRTRSVAAVSSEAHTSTAAAARAVQGGRDEVGERKRARTPLIATRDSDRDEHLGGAGRKARGRTWAPGGAAALAVPALSLRALRLCRRTP